MKTIVSISLLPSSIDVSLSSKAVYPEVISSKEIKENKLMDCQFDKITCIKIKAV